MASAREIPQMASPLGKMLTRFPNLHPNVTQGTTATVTKKIHLALSREDEATAIFSWAVFLNRYIGNDELVFIVDDDIVVVQVADWTIERSPLEGSLLSSSDGTGISIQGEREDKDLALRLIFERERGEFALLCASKVPQNHYDQLVLQLQAAVGSVLRLKPSNVVRDKVSALSLSIANHPPRFLKGPQFLHELINQKVSISAIAIDFWNHEDQRITIPYETLQQRSSRLASHLSQFRFQRDHVSQKPRPIAVLLPQSPALYISILAILKTSSAFCPLAVDLPLDRIDFILKDVSADIVLTDSSLLSRIPKIKGNFLNVVLFDGVWERGTSLQANRSTFPELCDSDLAYIYYTSGSTGIPKGVAVPHRSIVQSLLAHDKYVPRFSRFLQFAAPTFDVFIFELFFPLYRGATIVTRNRQDLLLDLPGFIDRVNIDAAELTPSVARDLLQKRAKVPNLKLLITIGEMLTQPIIQEFGYYPDNSGILFAAYGPTECAVHCTYQPNFPTVSREGIIGKPLDTVSAFIINLGDFDRADEMANIMPVGQVGELAVGGNQLATEYINRPEESKSSFIDTHNFGVLYRTGDMARQLPDGTFEMLGRIKSGQVKLRGQRIELGEIENTITLTKGCLSACVMIIDNLLVAFCAIKSKEMSIESVRQLCKHWLPSYMVPAEIILMERFPYLTSGKMDRDALRQRYRESLAVETNVLTDSPHVVKIVYDSASEILGRFVDINTQLSVNGLDSLKAIRFASLLRKLGYQITMLDLLEASTLKDVAERLSSNLLEQSDGDAASSSISEAEKMTKYENLLPPSTLAEVNHFVQSTPIQIAMLSQTLINPSMYCNWILLKFSLAGNSNQVRRYFLDMAASNEILRSGFISSDPSVQIIWNNLRDEQVVEVNQIDHDYSLSCEYDFLRPFRVQIKPCESGMLALMQLPHFMYDGWSVDLMLADLSELCIGNMPEQRPQYRKVNDYYQQFQGFDEYELSKEFWQKQVRNVSPCFLANYNGRHIEGNRQQTYTKEIEYGLETLLPNRKQLPFSSQTFFQSAFAYILCSYYGKSDITFGLVTSGRTIPIADADKIIGPCINTVPVNIRISELRTVEDLLQNVHDLNHEILKYGLLPLREIKSLSNLSQRLPMFDTLFNWQEPLRVSDKSKEQNVHLIDSADSLEFKLVLEIDPGEHSLRLRIRYHKSVFPGKQAKAFLNQLEELTKLFINSQQKSLANIFQSLSHSNLSISRRSKRNEPFINPVKIIQNMAKTCPNAVAIKYFQNSGQKQLSVEALTYKEFNSYTNRLANFIRTVAVTNTEIIAVCMHKSIVAYASILSIVKAGFGYVFITPETPDNRKRAILEQSDTGLCMSHSCVSQKLEFMIEFEVINIDTLNLNKYSCHDLSIRYNEKSIANATFTSGTSGKPKGVLVTLKNLQSNIQVLFEQYRAIRGDRLLQFCSLSFDVSVFDIFYSWCTGMCVCAADNDVLFCNLEAAIDSMDITHLSLTPTVAGLLDAKKVPKVRFLVTAGEAVTSTLIRDWAGTGLYQGYGPSETTNICTLRPRVAVDDLPSNVGWPLRNTSIFVLEEGSTNIVPRGGLGELCFGGDQVARGYIGFESLENEKFINHPLGGRLYRSGDLGRLLPNGGLLYHGRLDTQIKIRGQRVEVGELNTCILKVSFVRECASILVQPERNDVHLLPQLLSFWVPKKGFAPIDELLVQCKTYREEISVLFKTLTSELPSYMIPTHLIPINRIPITVQGKVDRKILSNLFSLMDGTSLNNTAQHGTDSTNNDTVSGTEKSIYHAISEILCIPLSDIQRYTSFFTLGLDSITAVPLSKSLSVPISMILKYSSVATLARAIDKSSSEDREESTVQLENVTQELYMNVQQKSILNLTDIKKVLPCTPLQEAMLSATELSGGTTYINRMLFKVNGDCRLLRKSWQFMVERHDILRTIFVPVENERFSFAQVILKKWCPSWISMTEEDTDYDMKLQKVSYKSYSQNWPVDQPNYCFIEKPVRGVPHLLFLCHHALYDGTAMENLLKEVEMHYLQHSLPRVLQYEPYLNQMLSLEKQSTDDFWLHHMRNYQPMTFPNLQDAEQRQPHSIKHGSVKRSLSLSLSYVEAQCKDLAINLLSLGQAIWAKLLSTYLGKKDICFGNVVSGRNSDMLDLRGLVAPCFNTIPVRIDIGKLTRNIDLANNLKEHNVNCLPFQLTSLRKVRKCLNSKIRQVFDTIFLLQLPKPPLDQTIWRLEEDVGDMDLAVAIELQPHMHSDSIDLIINFDLACMSNQIAELMLKTYDALLVSFLRYPAAQISDFGTLADDLLSTSKGWLLKDMNMSLASKSILHQIGFSESNEYAVVSDTGKVLPLLGMGELYAAVTSKFSLSHKIDQALSSKSIAIHNEKLLNTGLYARMYSSDNLSLSPIIDGTTEKNLSIYNDYLEIFLKSVHEGITNVIIRVLQTSGSFDEKVVVVLAVKDDNLENLARIENAAQVKISNIDLTNKKPLLCIATKNIPLIGDEIDEVALSCLIEGRFASKHSQHETTTPKQPLLRNTLFKELCDICSRISGVPYEQISLKTSIFQLGLDSINAIQISAQLRDQGRQIAATAIMDNPIIEELITYVEKSSNDINTENAEYDFADFEDEFWSKHAKTSIVQKEDVDAVRPCTAMQEGLLSQFINSNGRKYYNHVEYISHSTLDNAKLLRAWEEVVSFHPILRTGFIPLTNTDHCFAMIIYRDNSKKIPIEIYPDGAKFFSTTQAFLAQSAEEIQDNFQLPPWRMRIASRNGKTSMQFFALHALYDAHSLQILLNEFTSCYCGQRLKTTSFDPLLGKLLSKASDRDHVAESYWSGESNNIVVNAFPSISPYCRTSSQTYSIHKAHTQNSATLHNACRKAKVTIQALTQAAWSRLLATYLGVEDVTFGVVLAGRTDAQDQEIAFPCINTVPFHCNVERSNASLLQHSMDFNRFMQKYQDVPLSKIQRWVGRANESLFDTIIVYQRSSIQPSQSKTWRIENEIADTEYAISIEIHPGESGELLLILTSRFDVLAKDQAEILLNQYDQALIQIADSPQSSHGDFLQQFPSLLSHIPPKDEMIPLKGTLLHELVEVTAQKYPNNIALEFCTEIWPNVIKRYWTYREIDLLGNKIAHLISDHVGCKSLVAVCFDKCPEAYFTILGILKSGNAFVALDPAAPRARKKFILQDSEAQLILTCGEACNDITDVTELRIVNLGQINLDGLSGTPLHLNNISSSDVCYCLYTSGSTGTAKGCDITHENSVQAMAAFHRLFAGHWQLDSRWLQFASFHFDVSVLEQYWSWSAGITLISAPKDLILQDLTQCIRKLGITHLDLTPSLAQTLIPEEVPSLCKGIFIVGGEPLKKEIVKVWGRHGVIYNGYGPTETTIGVTMLPRVSVNDRASNIGWQFDNVGSFVLSAGSENLTVRGAIGELCIYGKLVGNGYRNRSELTRERFPYHSQLKLRYYRTGDLVRLLHNNSFDYIGRSDLQVKLRGQRLELSEIDSVIRSHSDKITNVVTILMKHQKTLKDMLVSFIVLQERKQIENADKYIAEKNETIATVREICSSTLPPYMVPTFIISVPSIPLTANNKVNKAELERAFETWSKGERNEQLANETNFSCEILPSHQKIIDNLSLVLHTKLSNISPKSNVFSLGLDSVTMIKFVHVLKDSGFTKAQNVLVMQNPTISSLAKALGDSDAKSDEFQLAVIEARQRMAVCIQRHQHDISMRLRISQDMIEDICPCTPIQEGMIIRSLDSAQELYFMAFYYELQPGVDVAKLRLAWENVLASLQILRVKFMATGYGYVQVVLKESQLPWIETKVNKAESLTHHCESLRRSWKMKNGNDILRPYEVVLIDSENGTTLGLHIFHGLYDAISLSRLMKCIAQEYESDPSVTYGPSYLDCMPYGPLLRLNGAEAYWSEYLAQAQHAPLPQLINVHMEEDVQVKIDLHKSEAIEARRQSFNVTSQAIFQACWISVLYEYFENVVTIGLVVSGRSLDLQNAADTIGPLFNTIPFCLRIDLDDTWRTLIQKCHEINVASTMYHHTPLRDIMKWTGTKQGNVLFDTLFSYQSFDLDNSSQNRLWKESAQTTQSDFALALEVQQTSRKSVTVTLAARKGIGDKEKTFELLCRFREAIMQTLEQPDSLVLSQTSGYRSPKIRNSERAVSLAEIKLNIVEDPELVARTDILRKEIAVLASVTEDDILRTSSVFEFGLDSIDMMKLASRLKSHRFSISINSIMKGPIIQKIAANMTLEELTGQPIEHGEKYAKNLDHLRKIMTRSIFNLNGVEQLYPATPLQESLVTQMIQSQYSHYFNHDILKIHPHVHIDQLKKAWMLIYDHSPILRTSFFEIDDPSIENAFAQIIHPSTLPWKEVNLSNFSNIDSVLDLTKENMVREGRSLGLFALTFVSSDDSKYLILSMSHALYDGWSISLLHSDVCRAYHGKYVGRPDYGKVVQKICEGSSDRSHDFWSSYLSQAKSSLMWPKLLPYAESRNINSDRHELITSVALNKLQTFCKRYKVTMQAVSQTCFALVLASYLRKLDVCFGITISGRDSEEDTQILFPMMNTIIIRSVLFGSRLEMVQYMQENMSSVRPHQHFPLRKALALRKDVGNRLIDTLFIHQKQSNDNNHAKELLYESTSGVAEAEFPLCVEMEVVGSQIIWRLACLSSLATENFGVQYLRNLDAVLNDIIDNPSKPTFISNNAEIAICGLKSFPSQATVRSSSPANTKLTKDYTEPDSSSTELESTIRTIICTVAGIAVESVNKGVSIFHLGLDSISVLKVAALLRKKEIHITVSQLLKAANIKDMAATIEQIRSDKTEAYDYKADMEIELRNSFDHETLLNNNGLSRSDVHCVIPATPMQLYMLAMWENSKGTLFYPCFTFKFKASVTYLEICNAWQSLVCNVPILRIVFLFRHHSRHAVFQALLKDTADQVQNAMMINERKASKRYEQPYVRLEAVYQEDTWMLNLHIHHALYDAYSLRLIKDKFAQLLTGGSISPDPVEPYVNYVALCHGKPCVGRMRHFWKDYLLGANPLQLRLGTDIKPTRTEILKSSLISDMDRIKNAAKEHGLTIGVVLLAIYAQLYAKLINLQQKESQLGTIPDIVFGIYIANRGLSVKGLSDIAVPTLNLVPLRVKNPISSSVLSVAAGIQQDVQKFGNGSNALVSLWQIREWTGIVVESFVNFLGNLDEENVEGEDGDSRIPSTTIQLEEFKGTASEGNKYPNLYEANVGLFNEEIRDSYKMSLDVEFSIKNNGLDVGVFAPSSLFTLSEANKFLDDFQAACIAFCQNMAGV